MKRRFDRRHAWTALWTTGPFILFVLLFTGSPLIAVGTLLGPMAGIVQRGFPEWDGCCAQSGLTVLPWGAASLAAAFATQWLLPDIWGGRWRLVGWVLGLAGWCFTAIMTYGHTLE